MQPNRLRIELLELILNFTGLTRVDVKRAKLFCTVEFPAYHPLLFSFAWKYFWVISPPILDSLALVTLFHAILSFSRRERKTIGQRFTSWQKWSISSHMAEVETCDSSTSSKYTSSRLEEGCAHRLADSQGSIWLLQWICKLFFSLITDLITRRPQRTPILKRHHLTVAITDSPTWQSYLSYSLCTQPSICRFKFITCKWHLLPGVHMVE